MNNEDVLQRNAAGELEIRTAPSTGDTGTNPDDVYTRDEQGRLCVRTTGGGGGGGTTPTAAGVSFDPADLTTITGDNVQSALEEVDAALSGKVATAQGAENAGKVMTVGEDGNLAPANVPAGGLPDQTGNAGKFLKTDGTSSSWEESINIDTGYIGVKTSKPQVGIILSPSYSNFNFPASRGVFIGLSARSTGYFRETIAIGNGATVSAAGAMQFGDGTNTEAGSVCFALSETGRDAVNYKLLGSDGIIPAERLPQTNYGLKISDTFTQGVNTATTYNLFTTVDLASDVTLAANMNASNYSLVDGALKLPTNAGYVDYGIEVRLNGSFAGGENTNREFGIQLQRADGTIISEKAIVKVPGNDLSKCSVVFETYTNTDTDPFIANGLKLVINNTSGQTLNLTGCDILIKARA